MDYVAILRESSRDRSRWAILLAEMALTMAISINAFALMSSQLTRILEPSGIAVDEVTVFASEPFWQNLDDTRRFHQLTLEDVERVRALPGVQAIGTVHPVPLKGGGSSSGFTKAGAANDANTLRVQSPMYSITPGTLDALGLELTAGRDFTAQDLLAPSQPGMPNAASGTAIVTQAFATTMFGDEDPLGKVIAPGEFRIIGVVKHMKTPYGGGPIEERIVFFPEVVARPDISQLVIRSAPEDQERLLATVPDVLLAAEDERIITGRLMSDIQARGLASQRLLVRGMGLTIALLIGVSALAVYGVSSSQVTRRRRQIGMRRALGASRGQIIREVLSEHLGITAGAMALGIPAAHVLNWTLASKLEIAGLESWWICAAVVWFLVLGTLATLEPALRAARLSPAIASKAQ